MIIPVVHTPQPAATDEYREMKVALKLLAGKDCVRDASQAQVMLLRLSDSPDSILAADAARLVAAGMRSDWFGSTAPKYYELERIAEASLARADRRSPQNRQALALALALGLALLLGGLLFLGQSAGSSIDGQWPLIGIASLVLLLAGLKVAFVVKKNR